LLIPGWNDSDEELDAMTRWVVRELGSEVPMHFTAFHPDWKMMDVPATPAASLQRARLIAMKNGVHYAYTGNVRDKTGQSTWCHHCGLCLIGRDGYQLDTWQLDGQGRCMRCATVCPGVFEETAGDWGSRRRPIRLADYAQ
jgi:pyruvate formate lyase activating enzyme